MSGTSGPLTAEEREHIALLMLYLSDPASNLHSRTTVQERKLLLLACGAACDMVAVGRSLSGAACI